MTATTWLALAFAAVAFAGADATPTRVAALSRLGRIASSPTPDSRVRTRTWWSEVTGGTVVAAVVATSIAGGVLLGVAAAAACGCAAMLARDLARRRAEAAAHAHLLGSLRVLVGELEAGARPGVALAAAAEGAGRYAAVFSGAAREANAAGDAGAVLLSDPMTRPVGLAWRLGEETGVALAAVLNRVALDLAAMDEQRRAAAVALSGPRASGALLTGLPLLGIALGAAMGARPWTFLFGVPIGRGVCCVGVLLDVAGVLWMRRILRRAEAV